MNRENVVVSIPWIYLYHSVDNAKNFYYGIFSSSHFI